MISSTDNIVHQKEEGKKINLDLKVSKDQTKNVDPEVLGDIHRKKLNSIIKEVKNLLRLGHI